MDEETEGSDYVPVGQRLRAAREEKGLSLDDLASETRIPHRHLESLELGEWDKLPAPTYSIGFAKSYAGAVGLDRGEVGEQLRTEMGGGYRNDSSTVEHFEPIDPARTMPKWLVLGAIVAIALVVLLFTWLRNSSLEEDTGTPVNSVAEAPANLPPQAAAPVAANPTGPVVLTAVEPAWIEVKDGDRTLFAGILDTGKTFPIPADAAAPTLKAGKPEALRVNVGDAVAPPVGPAGQVASNVSLKPADLMRAGPQAAAQPQPQNAVAQ
ncbi:helix-turn-helix domain-containing protein [Sphingomonas sabuli]|uniref:Helix-turn-helix domain-containing protein n=1 Tax=Sphingomonas sabuli TaxID=2764186 RepID=A0A7G9L1E9_9SPHN|nr:RodZ domain-containing protein [Sphingomonas sabuli]QNM82448.1 helix-turn-helix domain-containing protein [Sphingomonas sabuli]